MKNTGLIDIQKLVLVAIILVISVFLSILSPNFLDVQNLLNVLLQISVIITIASAANLLMITGNLDISVGSILAFSGVLFAYLSKNGFPIPLAMMGTFIISMGWGLFNGYTVSILKITPVIATMGTMYAARGFAFLIARWDGGANISLGLPPNFSDFGRYMLFDKIPLAIVLMILSVLIFLFIERKTVFGRFVFAIGCNKKASELSGIPSKKIVFILYILVALLSALCGIFEVSRIGVAAPNIGRGLEFDVVIAIVLGGTSMLGGEGSTIGMIFGALILGLITNGLNLLNIDFFYQEIFKGLLLIIAVLIDRKIKGKLSR